MKITTALVVIHVSFTTLLTLGWLALSRSITTNIDNPIAGSLLLIAVFVVWLSALGYVGYYIYKAIDGLERLEKHDKVGW